MRHIYKKISFNSTNFIFGILLFILVLTPQINNTDFVFSTITSKSICFFYGCIILIGFYTIQLVGKETFSFSITKLDIALLFLVAYITLNRYFIQIIFGFSIRYLELIGLVIFYISLRKLSLQKQSWLLLVITISGIIQALYGNLQLLGYYNSNHAVFKMTGSFFNPGPYAGFLISVWPIALGMYLHKEKIIEQLQLQINNQRPHYNQCLKYIFDYIPLLGLVSRVCHMHCLLNHLRPTTQLTHSDVHQF